MVGVEVSAAGVAAHYGDLLGGWVIDHADAAEAARVEAMGIRVSVVDTIMGDDAAAARLAEAAVALALGDPA